MRGRPSGRSYHVAPKAIFLIATVAIMGFPAGAAGADSPKGCVEADRTTIERLFDGWRETMKDAHPDWQMRFYGPEAVLETPTATDPLTTRDAQRAYWVEMLARNPRIEILSRKIETGCGTAVDRGTYRVTARLTHFTQETASYTVGYALTYKEIDGRWLIASDKSTLALQRGERAPEPMGQRGREPAIAGFIQRQPDGLTAAKPQTTQPAAVVVPPPQPKKVVPRQEIKVPPQPQPKRALQPQAVPQKPQSKPEMPRNDVRAPLPRPAARTTVAAIDAVELPRARWVLPVSVR
ncbi:MAG: hypothetical protein RL291_825 [Pseudomonadota bacterium]